MAQTNQHVLVTCIKKGNLSHPTRTIFITVFYWKFLFQTLNTLAKD